jgi:nucleotide-binding universal stress UspA family protein
MFKQVVVGVDEHGSRDAIALAKKLTADDGEIALAHVYPYRRAPAVRGYDEYDAAESVRARDLLRAASEDASVGAALHWTPSTSVGRGLHELVERLGADLLVVGSTRHGLVGRILVGDDTHAALEGAPCAVAVAPAGYAAHPGRIQRIGVGYDGSPESRWALAMARALANEVDATLAALEVVCVPAHPFGDPVATDRASIEHLVDAARERIRHLGGIEPHAAYGRATEELVIWSAGVDLLVVGSRGFGPVGRLMHGSTSQSLARGTRCPLLVLARAAPAPGAPDAPDSISAGATARV